MSEPNRDGRDGAPRAPGTAALARELVKHGADRLSAGDLIAVLLGRAATPETLARLQAVFRGSNGLLSLRSLSRASPAEIARLAGLGTTGVARLLAARELARRTHEEPRPEREMLLDPKRVYERFRLRMRDALQEDMYVLTLDLQNRVIREVLAYRGSADTIPVRMADILRAGIVDGASSLILVHNHPSGDATPSQDDIDFTGALAGLAEIVGIELLDHVIVGENAYYSFSAGGRL